ncbi:mechanosensitive ion channel family protein [Thiomicrospira sp. ALE5]|uniref:mechanosensitive ion channel family protein n=1 Tax=Thiomicrospira sp. ALE5 TaxID=748650 RepID=UPI0008EB60BD|nr:mechanosensitive ion channel domain-containing protein [Thiomicrospira sp. ALE5]SFR53836.1 miniconductance mechanosensitive channel [Thiomicrospira sp. ALE5]
MLVDWLSALFGHWIVYPMLLSILVAFTSIATVLLFVSVSFYLSRQLVRPWVNRLIDWFEGDTLDVTSAQRPALASHIAHLIPAILLVGLVPFFFGSWPWWESLVHTLTWLYLYVFIALTFAALADVIQAMLAARHQDSNIPFKVISQLTKLVIFIVLAIMAVSLLMGTSPAYLLSGLGALTAILLLVFRDALLGFVASIQIAVNRMVARGDWIEMPKYGANGSVIELALTTVKVRNFDNTVTTLPTYALISDSFKNWRAMQESGGRRIMRAILIDILSIRFVDADELAKIKQAPMLADFFGEQKLVNLEQPDLTNTALFRAYVEWQLRKHPLINQNLMVMVRQLQPSEVGLPIEIYCFSADKDWANYERIQSDIFDNLLATLPLFDLQAFQRVGSRRNEYDVDKTSFGE